MIATIWASIVEWIMGTLARKLVSLFAVKVEDDEVRQSAKTLIDAAHTPDDFHAFMAYRDKNKKS